MALKLDRECNKTMSDVFIGDLNGTETVSPLRLPLLADFESRDNLETSRSLALPFGRSSKTVVRQQKLFPTFNFLEPLSSSSFINPHDFIPVHDNTENFSSEFASNSQTLYPEYRKDNAPFVEMEEESENEKLFSLINYSNFETIPHPRQLFKKHKKKSSKKAVGLSFYNHLAQLKKKQTEFEWFPNLSYSDATDICAKVRRQSNDGNNKNSSIENVLPFNTYLEQKNDKSYFKKLSEAPLFCQSPTKYRNIAYNNSDLVGLWKKCEELPPVVDQEKEEHPDILNILSNEDLDFPKFFKKTDTNFFNLYNEE